VEDQNIPTEQEIYCQFHNQIRSISHKSRIQQYTCNISIEKECSSQDHQDYTRIPINGDT